jgi:murein DD-endopeptidase MepM/ murein hydrolase activator NlpD
VPPRVLLLLIVLTATLTSGFAPGAAAAGPAAPGPTPASAGLWTAPLAGALRVTRAFDPPATDYGAGHRGVDLAGQVGQQVLAAGAGVVLFAGRIAGRLVISVLHANGLRTTYEPVAPSVAAGQAVARGSPIGTLAAGHAGCPAGACLHWGLRRGDAYLDPLGLLRPVRVRLLPVPAHPA